MPHQFGGLTFAEFLDLYEGYKYRDDMNMQNLAQLAVWITAPHLKKPLTVDKLLRKNEKKRTTPECTKQMLRELLRDFDGKE